MKLLSALILSLGLSSSVWAEDEPSLLELLVSAKFAGGCGILGLQARFQADTTMNGGDEFLERFVNTETARLGVTFARYTELCDQANARYDDYLARLMEQE